MPWEMTKVDSAADRSHRRTEPLRAVSLRKATDLMSVIFLLITASTFVVGVFLVAFIWAVRRGQFDADLAPAVRILNDPPPVANEAHSYDRKGKGIHHQHPRGERTGRHRERPWTHAS